MIVYLDGRFLPEADASISIHDRGFLFADGVFETALLHDGGFFRLRQHLDRFVASAATMRLTAPSIDEIDGIARTLVQRNGLTNANLRFTLSRGVDHPVLLVTARPVDPDSEHRVAAGWRIITAATRRPSVAAAPAQLKTLGRPHALLARHEARAAGVDDALLLTDAGDVCEGPTWNVFWREGRQLFTPALDAGVLAGITRSVILGLAGDAGYDVREGIFPRPVLETADEIFATMTSAGMVPIRELDGRALTAPAELVATLLPRYRLYLAEQTDRDPA